MRNVATWSDRQGGAVHPTGQHADNEPHAGMTLRQHYAGQAIIGLLANSGHRFDPYGPPQPRRVVGMVETAFQIADAMVAEALK